MTYLPRNQGFFRSLWQKQGTVVAGTWAWATQAPQTNYASLTGEGTGVYLNSTYADLNEYKWSNVFLTKGSYKITIIYMTNTNRGLAEVLFGTVSLGTKDMYNAAPTYNQLWEVTFTLTADQTADLRFRVNGKNAASTAYYVTFSRFEIERTG